MCLNAVHEINRSTFTYSKLIVEICNPAAGAFQQVARQSGYNAEQ